MLVLAGLVAWALRTGVGRDLLALSIAPRALDLDPATTTTYRLLAATHLSRGHYDLALGQIDRALEIKPSDADSYAYRGVILIFSGKSAEENAEAVEACDRALTRGPGRNTQLTAHPILAASYAEPGMGQDAKGERAIIARLSPFFNAGRFASQFGTPEARDHMLDGLKKAGFR